MDLDKLWEKILLCLSREQWLLKINLIYFKYRNGEFVQTFFDEPDLFIINKISQVEKTSLEIFKKSYDDMWAWGWADAEGYLGCNNFLVCLLPSCSSIYLSTT